MSTEEEQRLSGIIRIEWHIEGGNLKILLNAPLETEAQREMTTQVLSGAIPIAITFRPSLILKPSSTGPGLPPPPGQSK